jgi:uncharacterized protein (DUF2384 family)
VALIKRRVARVRNLGRTLFRTDEAVSEWLSKPDASLGNMAPWDLLDTDLGALTSNRLHQAVISAMVQRVF